MRSEDNVQYLLGRYSELSREYRKKEEKAREEHNREFFLMKAEMYERLVHLLGWVLEDMVEPPL